jgi:hypothetical protein
LLAESFCLRLVTFLLRLPAVLRKHQAGRGDQKSEREREVE